MYQINDEDSPENYQIAALSSLNADQAINQYSDRETAKISELNDLDFIKIVNIIHLFKIQGKQLIFYENMDCFGKVLNVIGI